MYSVGLLLFSFSISELILGASTYMKDGLDCEVVIVSFSSVRFWSAWNLFVIGISPSQFSFRCILVSILELRL